MSLLSVIIPFNKREADSGCIQRLDSAIRCFAALPDIEVIVYDISDKAADFSGLSSFKQHNLRTIHNPEISVSSLGVSLNHAADEAVGRYLLMFSADYLLSDAFAKGLTDQVAELEKQGGHAFALYPCLTLNKSFSSLLTEQDFKSSELFASVLSSYLKGQLEQVENHTFASGGILVRRHWFTALGGFRNEFQGGEYAFFDLVHRLVAYYPIGKKPEDYALDVTSHFPAGAIGYRRYFSFYSLPHLFEGRFIVRRLSSNSLREEAQEADDAALFTNILAKGAAGCRSLNLASIKASSELGRRMLQRPFDSKEVLPSLQDYIGQLMSNHDYDLKHYPGLFQLFEEKKLEGGVRKKLRQLFYHKPMQLFKKINTKKPA